MFIIANVASRPELEPVLLDGRVVFVDEDSVLPKPDDIDGWHYQQVRIRLSGMSPERTNKQWRCLARTRTSCGGANSHHLLCQS